MHDDRHIVEQRLDRVLAERLRPAQHRDHIPCDIAVWHAPGEPVDVTEALRADYTPTAPGQPWGPAWGTSWFRVTATVPEHWDGQTVEMLIALGFDADCPGFQCEGLAHTPDGIWRAAPPARVQGNPTGAGDSVVAGLLSALAENLPWPDRLARAAALSTATVLSPAAGEFDRQAYEKLLGQVAVTAEVNAA